MLLARTSSFDGIDRAFQHLTAGLASSAPSAWRSGPAVNAAWRGDDLELTVDLPGVPRDAVAVDVADRTLTITVEHATDNEQMRWSRSVSLGGSLDAERVTARYLDGRLTVVVPPVAKAPARRIELSTSPADTVASIDVVSAESTDTTAS